MGIAGMVIGLIAGPARRIRVLAAMLTVVMALPQAGAQVPLFPQGPAAPEGVVYVARAGDVLDILVIGEPDLSRTVTVTSDGLIFLPLIGNVRVEGLTIKQIEDDVAKALTRYVKEPKVLVSFERVGGTGDFVYALGQVARPGAYQFRRGVTVAELLALAGGPTPTAGLAQGLIIHKATANFVDLQKLLSGDASQNQVLQPGDVLVVPDFAKSRILVLGQVTKPGYVMLKEGDRILDAVVEAGGPTLKAAPERIRFLRKGQPVKTDLETFLREGTLDLNPLLEPGDIVVMPETDRRVIVLGQVAKPGPVDLGETFPKTVMDAIAAAGGPATLSKLDKVYVIRQAGTAQPTAITVDVWKYLHEGGVNQNIMLQPGDVVFVPTSPLQTVSTLVTLLSGLTLIRVLLGLPTTF